MNGVGRVTWMTRVARMSGMPRVSGMTRVAGMGGVLPVIPMRPRYSPA